LGNDRAPAIDEIRTLIDYPDRRIKPIVYTMVSSGIRLGAWDYLRWGDIEPIMQDEKVVAAKMVVYRGDAEEYITFMAPEAYHALKDWMHYREMSGEKVTKDSWVMRNLWNVEHYITAL
jgi:integrase